MSRLIAFSLIAGIVQNEPGDSSLATEELPGEDDVVAGAGVHGPRGQFGQAPDDR